MTLTPFNFGKFIKTIKANRILFAFIVFAFVGLLTGFIGAFLRTNSAGMIGAFWQLRYWTYQTNILALVLSIIIFNQKMHNTKNTIQFIKALHHGLAYLLITGIIFVFVLFPLAIWFALNNPDQNPALKDLDGIELVFVLISNVILHAVTPVLFFVVVYAEIKRTNVFRKLADFTNKKTLFASSMTYMIYPICYMIFGIITYYTSPTNDRIAIYPFFDFARMGYVTIAVVPAMLFFIMAIPNFLLLFYKKSAIRVISKEDSNKQIEKHTPNEPDNSDKLDEQNNS